MEVIGRNQRPSEVDGQVLSRAVFALGQLVRVEPVRELAIDLGVPQIVVPLLLEEVSALEPYAQPCPRDH